MGINNDLADIGHSIERTNKDSYRAMADITKHDCEKEREQNDGEGARINLAISGHAISVD